MNKPDFIIAGAQKSGSTYIWSMLKQHPEVFFPKDKEINFFNTSSRSDFDLGEYVSLFDSGKSFKVKGEASPRYLFYNHVPKLMHELNPQLKLIFILRNPVLRAESHYLHNVRDGFESLSFDRAIEEEESRIKQDAFSLRAYSYVNRGLYAKQVKEYLSYFEKDQILLLKFEEFMKDKAQGFKELHSFLGVSDFDYNEQQSNKNERKYIKYRWLNTVARNRFVKLLSRFFPRNAKDRIMRIIKSLNQTQSSQKILSSKNIEQIKEKTALDVKELESITGWDLSDWKSYG